jgi:P27 family predicted phage terminase small subunit
MNILKLEKGTLYDEQRERAAIEPRPARELKPRCPGRFSPEERKAWRDVAAVLKNYGLFNAANAMHLEMLAAAWAQYLGACKFMLEKASNSLFVPEKYDTQGKGHGFKENPILRTQQRLRAEISVYAQNLGLSSVALARIGCLMVNAKRKEKDKFFDD